MGGLYARYLPLAHGPCPGTCPVTHTAIAPIRAGRRLACARIRDVGAGRTTP